jgi:hypothetical protein
MEASKAFFSLLSIKCYGCSIIEKEKAERKWLRCSLF